MVHLRSHQIAVCDTRPRVLLVHPEERVEQPLGALEEPLLGGGR